MFIVYCTSLLLLTLLSVVNTENEGETTIAPTKQSCIDLNRLISSDKSDQYKLVEAGLNSTVILECHYCSENDNSDPKIWHVINHFNKTPHEVELGMENNVSLNRISVSLEHSLIIKNVNTDDAGIYFCQGKDYVEDSENFIRYLLDVCISQNVTPPETGNLDHWLKHHEQSVVPLNNLLLRSNGTEFGYVRSVLKLNLEVVTEWETNWGPCEVCGKPHGKGTEEKIGYCVVKIINLEEHERLLENKNKTLMLDFFMRTGQTTCRSLLLAELFPATSNATRILPNFIQIKSCNGICNPDAEGINKGWKYGKSKGYKFRKMFVLAEKAHLTLVCPESTLDNVVIWRRNGKVLKKGETKGRDDGIVHIIVDTFNTLYLVDVTSKDDGNYTCQVDDINMQQVRIFIVSKSRLITKAFLRHMMYLSVVLSLSSFCYCSGIFLAWRRRESFKSYEEVMYEKENEDDRLAMTSFMDSV